jgi:ATP phosphoribosyltransferase regulatory subunit
VRAPWGEQAALRSAIRALRDQGHVVVCSLPGHGHETEEFACDRELVEQGEAWVLRPCELA